MRILLSDWQGAECWATMFDQLASHVLEFTANMYTAMTSEADRYASLAPLREARVMVTIKKRVKDTYVNYTVSELEIVGA